MTARRPIYETQPSKREVFMRVIDRGGPTLLVVVWLWLLHVAPYFVPSVM